MKKTGIVWDERYCDHETGFSHPESPKRLLAIKEVLDQAPQLIEVSPRLATHKEISWIHQNHHLQSVEKNKGQSGFYDGDTVFSAGSSEAAFLAAGGVLELIEKVENSELDNGFAFPRPPGHHAESDRAMGFCLFNNIAIGADYLIKEKNKKRVAIIDIDVHHGNGTQHSFYDRSDVFYISSHRYPFYPGTGAVDEKGRGEGFGYNLNLAFSAMSDDEDYYKGYQDKILPVLDAYQPDFILVSAGFDAHQLDPLGGMNLSQKAFKMMSQTLYQIAEKHCQGKIVFVLEGGYDMTGLQEGVEAVFDVIAS